MVYITRLLDYKRSQNNDQTSLKGRPKVDPVIFKNTRMFHPDNFYSHYDGRNYALDGCWEY